MLRIGRQSVIMCDVGTDLRPRNRLLLSGPQIEVGHSVVYI